MNKVWKHLPFATCDWCGDDVEVLTHPDMPENFAYDGDTCRCMVCGLMGTFCTDGEDNDAHVIWNDTPTLKTEWEVRE